MIDAIAKRFTDALRRIVHEPREHNNEEIIATENQAESRIALSDKSLWLRSGSRLDWSPIEPVLE